MPKANKLTLTQECSTDHAVVFSNREKYITLIVPKTNWIRYLQRITVTIHEDITKGV